MRKLAIAFALLAVAIPAWAHKEDYIGETLVFMTLARHSLEPEMWLDEGKGLRTLNAAAEYGITNRWMCDARVTWRGGDQGVDSARAETRYRFGEEGTRAIDVAVSAEVNVERDADRSRRAGIEPRLILSKDLEKMNFTVNVADEVRRGAHGLVTAAGFRYDTTRLFQAGAEAQYRADEQRGIIMPQVWFTFPHDLTIKVGYGHGLRRSTDQFARIAVEYEWGER